MDTIGIESDSQLVINSITGLIKVCDQIINHVKNIVNLARNFDNTHFTYYTKSQNGLADRIAKSTHCTCVNSPFLLMNSLFQKINMYILF